MAEPTRLLLIRHGETEWNMMGRLQGHSDITLNAEGRRQVAAAAQRLAARGGIDLILTSDLKRAAESAAIIGEAVGATVRAEPRLRELGFGMFEGLTWAEIEAQHPEIQATWLADRNQPPQGGERLEDFAGRVSSLLGDVLDRFSGKTVALTTHGGTIRELLRLALEMGEAQRWLFQIDNGSLTELAYYDGRPLLVRLNDTGHLPAG